MTREQLVEAMARARLKIGNAKNSNVLLWEALNEDERAFVFEQEAAALAIAEPILTAKAREEERARCKAILSAARFGEIDTDMRSLIYRVESGSKFPDEADNE